ncbi:hypothetical protein [Pectobacterium odoriferum]|uniref:hypothetical protein n=1 Tax=Pectobacterium odoriferum TaxID=78398 RepID=UPI00052A6313|nr:hypothetical protein [Pectobacterium odoriferum]AIU87873.1 hypothetical protein BCS7_06695 [Pectobacterium odoriferum]POE18284.1 hypothetical protein BV918_09845 [Pectobacterium odoriferum]POE35297.1 hypothetical protein BV922_09830 [Pectobacterium odoriferum]
MNKSVTEVKAENKHTSKFNDFFVVLLFTYLIYSVNYRYLYIPSTYLVIVLFFCFFFFYAFKNNLKISYEASSAPLLLAFVFFIWSVFSYAINLNDGADLYMVRTSIVYFLMIFLVPFIVRYFFIRPENILLFFGLVGFVNAVFIFSMLLVKPFQEFYLSLIGSSAFDLIGGSESLDSFMSLRMIGITGLSVYSSGFMQMILAISLVAYMHFSPKETRLLYYVMLVLIILSALIAARSSIIGVLFFCIFSMSYFSIKKIIKILCVVILLLYISFISVMSFLPSDLSDFFLKWTTEIFLSGTKTGSVKENISMFIYDFNDFGLVGDSKWYGGLDGYYKGTDVGWYRMCFSVGYIGVIIWFGLLVSLFYRALLSSSRKIFLLSWCVFLYIIVMMFKGAVLFDAYQAVFVIHSIFFVIKYNDKLSRG